MVRRVNQEFEPVLTIDVTATSFDRLVYILVANRPLRYQKESSRIAYIGTTEAGVWRIASSASMCAYKSRGKLRGCKRLHAYVIWSRAKRGRDQFRGRRYHHILERAMLLSFRKRYGTVPLLNTNGNGITEEHEFKVFRRTRVERLIGQFAG